MLKNLGLWRVFACGLVLASLGSAQTWNQSKACAVETVSVLRAWQDYYGADRSDLLINSSSSHYSARYSSCFMTVDLWYLAPAHGIYPAKATLFRYLLEVSPTNSWRYITWWVNSTDYSCGIGAGKDALKIECDDAYSLIDDRMSN